MPNETFLTQCVDALDNLYGEDRRKIEYIAQRVMDGPRDAEDDLQPLIDLGRRIISANA